MSKNQTSVQTVPFIFDEELDSKIIQFRRQRIFSDTSNFAEEVELSEQFAQKGHELKVGKLLNQFARYQLFVRQFGLTAIPNPDGTVSYPAESEAASKSEKKSNKKENPEKQDTTVIVATGKTNDVDIIDQELVDDPDLNLIGTTEEEVNNLVIPENAPEMRGENNPMSFFNENMRVLFKDNEAQMQEGDTPEVLIPGSVKNDFEPVRPDIVQEPTKKPPYQTVAPDIVQPLPKDVKEVIPFKNRYDEHNAQFITAHPILGEIQNMVTSHERHIIFSRIPRADGSDTGLVKVSVFAPSGDKIDVYKSFVYDPGYIIDNRKKIFEGTMADVEVNMAKAYHITIIENLKDGKKKNRVLNKELIENILEFGFPSINPKFEMFHSNRLFLNGYVTTMNMPNTPNSNIRNSIIYQCEELMKGGYFDSIKSGYQNPNIRFKISNIDIANKKFTLSTEGVFFSHLIGMATNPPVPLIEIVLDYVDQEPKKKGRVEQS